jgi:hypothetical protein
MLLLHKKLESRQNASPKLEMTYPPEKTRRRAIPDSLPRLCFLGSYKSLIIGFNAVIYEEFNPWAEFARGATLRGVAVWKNHETNQGDSALTHP